MSSIPLLIQQKRLTTIFWLSILLSSCQLKEQRSDPSPEASTFYNDTVFWQEYHEAYTVGPTPAHNEVRSVAVDGDGNVWIATGSGVYRKKAQEKQWANAIPESDQGPAFSVLTDDDGAMWMGTWNGLYRYKNGQLEKLEGLEPPISVLSRSSQGVYAAGPYGIWRNSGSGFTKMPYQTARSIRDLIDDQQGGVWVGTDVGLYHSSGDSTKVFTAGNELLSAYIRTVEANDDEIWAGGLGGITILKNGAKVKTIVPANGLPSIQVNTLRRSPEGDMWVGTDVGVVRYRKDGSHSLLLSRRWLMDDHVKDITFDSHGNAWIATRAGVSAVKKKQMTLSSKERYFYDVLMRRHIRDPWIAGQCRLPVAGDTTQWAPEDDDNDGEYTGNYLAMESFRYAVTKSEDAKQKASKAFRFLMFLQEVTETDGFFARTIVPASWTEVHDGNRSYSGQQIAEALVNEPRFKPVTTRWHKSRDGKWRWKGDTSSDELCGHMFAYFFYYELAADEKERQIISRHVAKIMDHLMANDYCLTDIDGKATRWGVWSPEKLNRDPEWSPDRSLNSMELLSFLKLAYHVTSDEKYQNEYLRLIREEGYLANMGNIPRQDPAWFIYFDVILAAYQYPILLKCEKDPELLAFYTRHIDSWLEQRKGDKNPLINFIYCFSRDKKVELESSIGLLKDTPLDLVDWTIDHGRREDISLVHQPVLDDLQVSELQPASIRSTIRWDKNPWSVSAGNHHVEREPVFWLLPYWMGRYLEMIR
ncbi:MAG TPA: two-component regulator propeller domain-containing protein [Chryseolinea sp.]